MDAAVAVHAAEHFGLELRFARSDSSKALARAADVALARYRVFGAE
jgi:hypothetical protein